MCDRVPADSRSDVRHARRRLLDVAVRLSEERHVVPTTRKPARGNRECPGGPRPVSRAMQKKNSHIDAEEIIESLVFAEGPN